MVSVLTSCGNDSEFYDEHVLYTTRSINNDDNRMEIEVIAKNIDNFESDVSTIIGIGEATTSFSLEKGHLPTDPDAITASSECNIVLTDTLYSVVDNERHTDGYDCGKAYAIYNITFEKGGKPCYRTVLIKSKEDVPLEYQFAN